jgi:glycerophosphoryl diester phosphodiesterase
LRDAGTVFDVSAFIYGHRGLWGGPVPENSIAAFHAARAHGIGVELDVRLTADHELIVFHDPTFDRMFGDERVLRQMQASDVEAVFLSDGSSIPTLAQTLDAMGNLPVLLELKVDRPGDTTIAQVVADAIADQAGLLAIMSFDEAAVARLCQLIDDRAIGLLIDSEARIGADGAAAKAARARAMGCDYLAPHISSLATVHRHAGGLPLVTWTLRDPDELQLARKHGAAPIFEGFSPDLAKLPETPI